MNRLDKPRYLTAIGTMPGDPALWEILMHQSDVFSYETAQDEKGGPFGAQLWLVNENTNETILVGTSRHMEDSNAVVSKGLAGAHAEAENLSPEKRQMVIDFLEERQGQGWNVVQVSSGESCPSCRAKQVLFADELIRKGLIEEKQFNVIFKGTYDQTFKVADFNDAPYDQTFRAIAELGILARENKLFALESALKIHSETSEQLKAGELIYNPVNKAYGNDVPEDVREIFEEAGAQPVAVIVKPNGEILSSALDTRDWECKRNELSETAIIGALFEGARILREEEGKFESWNFDGAKLYTNISDIGPAAYAESLWFSLSEIIVAMDYNDHGVDVLAQEIPGTPNYISFGRVAADYDQENSPLNVCFGGSPDEANVAHLFWRAHIAKQNLESQQEQRIQAIEASAGKMLKISLIDGSKIPVRNLVKTTQTNSHYNGKQADTNPEPSDPSL